MQTGIQAELRIISRTTGKIKTKLLLAVPSYLDITCVKQFHKESSQVLTDFQNTFASRLSSKYVMN